MEVRDTICACLGGGGGALAIYYIDVFRGKEFQEGVNWH